MANFLAPIINSQQEDSNGRPLSGGTIEVYLAGSSTPVTTYNTQSGVANTWPIVLNTLGLNNQGAVWLQGGLSYKYVIKDSTGVVQRTIDNIRGINDSSVTPDQWITYAGTPTFVSATSFTLPGDQTSTFQVGRRIRTSNTGGTVYSTITSSTYGAPNTTITVVNDSGVLDSGISAVAYGLLSVQDSSLPGAFRLGQCRLVKSGANIVLQPYQGNQITINGATQRIPSAGVLLAPTGLTVGTLYYIYAAIVSGVMALEASTTGHSVDAATGVEIKTGDASRTLVGMVRPITGPAFQDTTNQRFVVSWFNQRPIALGAVLATTTGNNGTPGAYSLLTATLNLEYLLWLGNIPQGNFQGHLFNSVANAVSSTSIFLDGAANESYSASGAYTVNAVQPVSCQITPTNGPAEGYHIHQIYAKQDVNSTANYLGSGSPSSRCVHSAIIQG